MRLRPREKPPENADQAAIWWTARRQLEPARFEKDELFQQWLAEDANLRAWNEVTRRVDQVGAFATMPEIREMRSMALETARKGHPWRRRKQLLGTAMAASLAAMLALSSMLYLAPADPGPGAVEAVQRFATATGQRRDILLNDGSRVTLNTASLIEVRYSPERRVVRLLEGQAMFHVAKSVRRPFIVSARDQQVTALGTAFDVEVRQDGQVQVLLIEGRVRVDPVQPRGLERIIPALARTDLSPGQQLTTDGADAVQVVTADIERETAWNRGLLIFRNDRLADAVEEVNRYSQTQIVVDDPKVAALRVSGIFPTPTQRDFIAALEALYPVHAEQEQGGTIRMRWKGSRP